MRVLLVLLFASTVAFGETIFDRIIALPEAITEIPFLPPLCDDISGTKGYVELSDGRCLYYEDEGGDGMPLVLISGGPGGTHHVFHPYFSKAKEFARVIYYDQRGTGQSSSDETGESYTVGQAVEDLESLRKALGIERWSVFGWSYGGFLAQCYVLKYPDRILSLILAASADGLRDVSLERGRSRLFLSKEEQERINAISLKYEEGELTLPQLLYNIQRCGDWKRQGYYKPTEEQFIRTALYEWQPAPLFRECICRDMDSIALDGKFNDCEIPTLICEGEWDLTWNIDKREAIRRNHPHAQYVLFEKSGHCLFSDESERFFSLLKIFLNR